MYAKCILATGMILLMINIQQYHSDLALAHFKSEMQQMFKNTPKHWYDYIKMFTYISIKTMETNNHFQSCSNIKYFLCKVLKFSKSFMSINYRQFSVNAMVKYNPGNGEFSVYVNMWITFTSGQVVMFNKYIQEHNYNFHLDPKLSLNISLNVFYFESFFSNCNRDYLMIMNLAEKSQNYRYCGYSPSFNCYPHFSKVTIQIVTNTKMKVVIIFTFVVIDKGIIHNSDPSATFQEAMFVYQWRSNNVLTSFLLQTLKIYRI